MKSGSRINMRLMVRYGLPYLLIIFLVITSVSVYMYGTFQQHQRQMTVQQKESELLLLCETAEKEFSSLFFTANQLTASTDISPFVYRERPERALVVQRQLTALSVFNDFFTSVYLLFDADDYVYGTNSADRLGSFAKERLAFDRLPADVLQEKMRHAKTLEILPAQVINGFSRKGSEVIPVIAPMGYDRMTRVGSMLYLISIGDYQAMARRILGETCDMVLMGDELICTLEQTGAALEDILSAAARMEPGQTQLAFTSGQTRYLLLRQNGENTGLTYWLAVPQSSMQLTFTRDMAAFLALIGVCAVGSALLATFFTVRRVRPIQALHSMVAEENCDQPVMEEIHHGVQRLLDDNRQLHSSNSRLEEKIQSLLLLRKANFTRRFLMGMFDKQDDLLSSAEEVHVNVDRECYAVCVIARHKNSSYDLSVEKLDCFFDQRVSGAVCQEAPHRLAMVLFADTYEDMLLWLEERHSSLKSVCPGITIGISAPHQDISEATLAYLEMKHAFESRFMRGNSAILRYSGEASGGQSAANQKHLMDNLRQALQENDETAIRNALSNITREMQALNGTSLFAFQCMYTDILRVIACEGDSLGQDGVNTFYELFDLSRCLSLEDLDGMLLSACQLAMENRRQDESHMPAHVRAAMDILRRRVSDSELLISSVADEIGVADSLLSADFKRYCQMTPTEYLQHLRMRLACRLLETTQMPVKDIAIECGYYEISGFNRRFKAVVGKTPQQYRKEKTISLGG